MSRSVSLRSLIIGLFFVIFSSFIVSWAELVAGYIPLGYILPPPIVIGMRLYRKARMFFLGMIFGEFTMALIFTIYACITNNSVPFFPE
jgi:hypothetical protein